MFLLVSGAALLKQHVHADMVTNKEKNLRKESLESL